MIFECCECGVTEEADELPVDWLDDEEGDGELSYYCPECAETILGEEEDIYDEEEEEEEEDD